MKYFIASALILSLSLTAIPAYSQETATAPPTTLEKEPAEEIAKAGEEVEKKADAKAEAEPAPEKSTTMAEERQPALPLAEFAVINSDILLWEEHKDKNLLFVGLTEEKNDELAALTNENNGHPIQISVDDNFFFIPAITEELSQKDGFILPLPQNRRVEIMLMMDRSKKLPASTKLTVTETSFASAEK